VALPHDTLGLHQKAHNGANVVQTSLHAVGDLSHSGRTPLFEVLDDPTGEIVRKLGLLQDILPDRVT
jgi:hypothetical protein